MRTHGRSSKQVYAAFNRREFPPTTLDWANIDRRRGTSFAPGDVVPYVRAGWDVAPDVNICIVAVHRLSNLGAVVTHAARGSSQEGFAAEWRQVGLFTVEGDLISRFELFDEADIDAAVATFDDIDASVPQLDNAATRIWARLADAFNRHDVNGFLGLLTADGRVDDRRRGLRAFHVGAERRRAVHALFEATPESWRTNIDPVAIRGSHLSLVRQTYRDIDEADRPITGELLTLTEVKDDGLVRDFVLFDPENIDAALAELDARYLDGEAAPHSHTWSLVKEAYAAFNRRELPPTTSDWANIDRRRGTSFAPGDAVPYVRAGWDVAPDVNICIVAVHRLSNLGAVVTYAASGTSKQGFAAEWREAALLTFEGDLITRCEIFDEADLDAAFARFDELSRPTPQLDNAATRAEARVVEAFNRHDLDSFLALFAVDGRYEDRRKGLRDEGPYPDFARAMFSLAPASWWMEMESVAVRGHRWVLCRHRYRDADDVERPITVETLTLAEVTDDELVYYTVLFDPDDIDAAFAELDARYLAGDAAAYAHTWVIIAGACAAFNLHESSPTTPDWTTVDHRRAVAVAPGDMTAFINATLELTPDVNLYIEAVHRLSNLGAVVTHVMKGTSLQGFDAEWRVLNLMTVEGDLINRCELFDEADLDAALARFDELSQPTPHLENAATRILARMMDALNRRDLDSFLALVTATDDTRTGEKGCVTRVRSGRTSRVHCSRGASELAGGDRAHRHQGTSPCAVPRDVSRSQRGRTADRCGGSASHRSHRRRIDLPFGDFRSRDIDGAMAELTARWIASGEVAHPEVIEAARRLDRGHKPS